MAWEIKITRYTNASDYDLMHDGQCFGSFHSVQELNEFADMLRRDLAGRKKLSQKTRDDYHEIIAVIEGVSV